MSTADPFNASGDFGKPPGPPVPLLIMIFSMVGGLLYGPAISAAFSSDDYLHIGRVAAGGIPFIPDGQGYGFLRPTVGLSFWVEYQLWGTHPLGYHLNNVILHIANSLLVVYLAQRLFPPGPSSNRSAILAGFIFLTLACHGESVSWVSGRTDVLATFFSLLTLCAVSDSLLTGSRRAFAVGLLCFGLALFSKESALAVPPLLLLTAVYLFLVGRLGVCGRRLLGAMGACVVVLVIYFLIRYGAVGAFVGGYGARGHLRFQQDLLAQAMSRFAWRVFLPPLPENLSPFFATYGNRLGDVFSLLCLFVIVLWAFLAWKSPKRRTGLFLFLGFWGALLPVINIRVQWSNVEGERFMYLASIFAAIGASYFLMGLRIPYLRRGFIALFVLFQAALLWQSTNRWHDACAYSEQVISGIQAAATEGHVVLVNKPDSYNGALVLRTGLEDGVRYFGNHPTTGLEIDVLYASTLFAPTHDFTLTRTMDDESTMTITALNGSAVMVEEDRLDRIDTIFGDQNGFTFQFKEGLPEAEILYYTFRGVAPLTNDSFTK